MFSPSLSLNHILESERSLFDICCRSILSVFLGRCREPGRRCGWRRGQREDRRREPGRRHGGHLGHVHVNGVDEIQALAEARGGLGADGIREGSNNGLAVNSRPVCGRAALLD